MDSKADSKVDRRKLRIARIVKTGDYVEMYKGWWRPIKFSEYIFNGRMILPTAKPITIQDNRNVWLPIVIFMVILSGVVLVLML